MFPDEDGRFGHLVRQRAVAADGLGATGHEPTGRPCEHGVDERPAVCKMQVDRAAGYARLRGHIGQGEARQAEPGQTKLGGHQNALFGPVGGGRGRTGASGVGGIEPGVGAGAGAGATRHVNNLYQSVQ
jgi:hypothetical protein